MTEIIVGVDVCKTKLDVWIANEGHHQFENDASGIEALTAVLRKFDSLLVICEATGGYENALVRGMHKAQLPVARVNPKRVRRLAEAFGLHAKTDKLDARLIAEFARVNRDRIQLEVPPEPNRQLLLELRRQRAALVDIRTALRQRMRSFQNTATQASNQRVITSVQEEIDTLDAQIEVLIESDSHLKEQAQLLMSVPGVGMGTATALLSELPELGKLNAKAIASLVGVAPHPKESGQSKGKRFCREGRRGVRKVLYMAALSATRFNPTLRAFYQRLRGKNKPGKVALTACMRKLLVWLNAMMRSQRGWLPELPQAPCPAAAAVCAS